MTYLFKENGKAKTNFINMGLVFVVSSVILCIFLSFININNSAWYYAILAIWVMLTVLFAVIVNKPIQSAKKRTYLKMTETHIEGISYDIFRSRITGVLKVFDREKFSENLEDVFSVTLKRINGEEVIVIITHGGKKYNILGIEGFRNFIQIFNTVA